MLRSSMDTKLHNREKRLENNLTVIADVILHYGDVYWPIYDRLETELDLVKSRRRKLLKRYHSRASK